MPKTIITGGRLGNTDLFYPIRKSSPEPKRKCRPKRKTRAKSNSESSIEVILHDTNNKPIKPFKKTQMKTPKKKKLLKKDTKKKKPLKRDSGLGGAQSLISSSDTEVDYSPEDIEKRLPIFIPTDRIGHAAYVLKDWINFSATNAKSLPIPRKILEDLFIIEHVIIAFWTSNEAQKKLLSYISNTLIEQARIQLISKKMENVQVEKVCFTTYARLFDEENLSILTPITKNNMPPKHTLASLFQLPSYLVNCLIPSDVESMRLYILDRFKCRKLFSCDCCVQYYIKNSLQFHSNKNFSETFENTYKRNGLTQTISCYDTFVEFYAMRNRANN